MKEKFEFSESELRKIISSELKRTTPSTKDEKWITRKEACNRLNISFPSLYNYISSGQLTKHKVGRKVFFLAQDVEDIIINGKTK